MKNLLFVSFYVVILLPIAAQAGPFGLDMGMSLNDVDPDASQAAPGVYTTTKVPNPHSAFEQYAIKIGPKSGLCWIKAIGKDISTSRYGVELKSAFNEMKERLERGYGENITTDMLFPRSIWNEPEDFMMGMLKKERFLMAVWDEDSGAQLRENIVQIGLVASALRTTTGYLSVEYSFSNKSACDGEIEEMQDDVL